MMIRSLLLAALLALPCGAAAQGFLAKPGASAWKAVKGGRLRLVAAPAGPDGMAIAGLEIELEPGFKTYWWNPGADGIPPEVSFFGSSNVADAKLKLPPPHVFREATVTVGYKGAVRFPIVVATEAPRMPYRLEAAGVLGFCADVCVPVPFHLEVASPLQASDPTVSVPTGGNLVKPSDGLKIDAARYDPSTGRMEVHATVPDTDVHLEMVVANPGATILPPAAMSVHQKGDKAVFEFDVSKSDADLKDGDELTFTLVVAQFGLLGRIGVEQTLSVERVD